jgi:ABC-type glutathione transport system ATPase component
MYGGSVVESGPTDAVFAHMAHPYTAACSAPGPTWAPTRAAPDHHCRHGARAGGPARRLPVCRALRLHRAACHTRAPRGGTGRATASACAWTPCVGSTGMSPHASGAQAHDRDAPHQMLQVDQPGARTYTLPREKLWARRPGAGPAGGELHHHAGRSLGIVGESGSGKSTLARLVMALEPPTAGSVRCWGATCHTACGGPARARRDFQMVFQDPYGSLDPRQTVERIVTEPLPRRATPRAQAAPASPRGAGLGGPARQPTWTNTRTNFPAASASASPSPAP